MKASLFFKKNKQKKYLFFHGGFTLIELLVASAIFVTVMTLAIEALFAAQNSYVKVDGLRSVMDNLNTSFDLMTRDARYGSVFFCGTSIEDANRSFRKNCKYGGGVNDGGTAIMFKPANAATSMVRKGYYLLNSKVYEYAIAPDGSTSTLPITGEDVMIDSLRFFVQGANTTASAVAKGNTENAPAAPTDTEQPVITFIIAGRAVSSTQKMKDSYFQLQTTVAARHIDI